MIKNKLYSLHAPEVECIAKGKSHKKYEFGSKVSIATTSRSNFIVGILSLDRNQYDGHSLGSALAQVKRLTNQSPAKVFVDRDYRGHDSQESTVFICGSRKASVIRSLKRDLKRRSAIEPVIGHLKSDGSLSRNHYKGSLGDKINAIMSGACQTYGRYSKSSGFFIFITFSL